MKQKKDYNIDIITTEGCNFRCVYCVESGFQTKAKDFKNMSIETLKKLVDKIHFMLLDDGFSTEFGQIRINFWGGEPTLNLDAVRFLVDKFKDNDRIKFYLFTNGYRIDPLLEILLPFKNHKIGNQPKFGIQISYDGLPVQDIKRKSHSGKTTGKQVRENIIKCINANIPFVVHPVITVDTLKHMHEAYLDFKSLYKYKQKYSNNQINIEYSPHLDYFNEHRKYFKLEYLDDLYDNMLKIAIDEQNEGRKSFFWLNKMKNKRLCSVGTSITAMDKDGNFYFCHGAFFHSDEVKKNFYVANINEDNAEWLGKLSQASASCQKYHFEVPDKCNSCESDWCLRCQVLSFSRSEKTEFWDKWIDYNADDFNCKLFKTITLFKQKIHNKLGS